MAINKRENNFYYATAVMIGYIIGVGMFGLPYVVAKAGLVIFFVFIIGFSLIAYLLHLIYADTIISTDSDHRLPGYAAKYLGEGGKYLAFSAKMIGNLGALLAYIIITGIFLHELLGPILGGTEFMYATALFVIGAVIVYYGIKTISKSELLMTGLLLLVVILIVQKGWCAVEAANFHAIDWRYAFLPYGVMLFSLDGCGSLPIVVKLLKKDKKQVKQVVRLGTFISAGVIAVFTLVIVGISGTATTPDALVGLREKFDNGVILFSLLFGVLTITTSFLLVSESVKETLWWDFKVNKKVAWAIAVFVPYLFYFFGVRNLTNVISFAGGVAGGLSAIILVLIFYRRKKKQKTLALFTKQPSNAIVFFLITLFLCGVVYEIYQFIH